MSIVSVVHLNSTTDSLVSAGLDGSLECVGVVEVLHGLAAQVDAQLLQLTWFAVLEAEHVEDANETILRVSHSLAEYRQTLGGFLAASSSYC